jgi:hypothetical protein
VIDDAIFRLRPAGVFMAVAALACSGAPPPSAPVLEAPLAVGESRSIELRFLRFDVQNYQQTLTKKDILALPEEVRQRLWLLDLDLTSGPTAPRLLDNALAAIKAIDPTSLSPAARNMQRLLRMTADNADLNGTKLEKLVSLAPLLGVAPERVLADLLGVDVEDTILSPAVIARTILEQVIGTHPNARTRLGPKTPQNPDGLYPVTPGTLPITLADAATNFASLSTRFGPIHASGVDHPGFIVGETRARVLTDDFRLTVRANANALPYKGVDLASAAEASVNSVRSQIAELFDFDDPNWLVVEGLVPGAPVIDALTFRIVEDRTFVPGGTSPFPSGFGSCPGWTLPPWALERVVLGAAERAFVGQSAVISYRSPDHPDPLFTATVKDGWQTIDVSGGVGSPPAPSYLWDLLVEVAQVRLHDGGIAEGDGDVEFTLHDIPAGTDTSVIEQTIKDNLAADPNMLVDVASDIIDTTRGDADFYYYRSNGGDAQGSDYLFFVDQGDIRQDASGRPVRPYAYTHPGFFADPDLRDRVSHTDDVEGDIVHQKVHVQAGTMVYAEGAGGLVFEILVGAKTSTARLPLSVTRIR